MKVIVGLGNPGQKYSRTRHNVGFMAVEKIAERWEISSLWHNKKTYQMAEYRSKEKIILVKPQTYMNLSGHAVAEIVNWHKISVRDIIVVYDDTALPIGKIRIRPKGSSGGHKGIESLICQLGADTFLRVRIGVDYPPEGWDLADYVLSGFGAEETLLLAGTLERAADAVECILKNGVDEAMNKFN